MHGVVSALAQAAVAAAAGGAGGAGTPDPGTTGAVLLRLAEGLVENVGQWDAQVRFVRRSGPVTAFVGERGWTLSLADPDLQAASRRGAAVRMSFAGAGATRLLGEDRLPGDHNYFLGRDPARWRSGVARFGSVRMSEVAPGVDVRVRGTGRHFEYDLLLEPGADLRAVAVLLEGGGDLRLDEGGALVLATAAGELRQPPPRSWEVAPRGEERALAVRHVLLGGGSFGFDAPGRDPRRPLVIDPQLVYSTFLGGAANDRVHALAADPSGAATVAGFTFSAAFPTTPGAFDLSNAGNVDAFVARIAPGGASLVYSPFLGGIGTDAANALVLDAAGGAAVGGDTNSTDFPTTPGAIDATQNGGPGNYGDAFFARLSPSGAALVDGTYFGGSGADYGAALAVDGGGELVIGGRTTSLDLPTMPGCLDATFGGTGAFPSYDAFVARLASAGTAPLYSTYLGGVGNETLGALAVSAAGEATAAGSTASADFPTTAGAYAPSLGGSLDGFVARLTAAGTGLVTSTFLGSTGAAEPRALAVDGSGRATVAGRTGFGFPTTPGAFDTTFGSGTNDGFACRLSSSGGGLLYSTYLGGVGNDEARALALSAGGSAVVAGRTSSPDFPTTPDAIDAIANGGFDVFLCRLSESGAILLFSTFLGGGGDDEVGGLALGTNGTCALGGWTVSPNFPATPGAFDTALGGPGTDGFVSTVDLAPAGVVAYGASTPGCTGPLDIGATSGAEVGNAAFAITCGNAPPSATDFLAVSGGSVASPSAFLGAGIWIDLAASPFFALVVTSDASGASVVPLPIPANPLLAGGQAFFQFFWSNPCAPGSLCASNALAVTVQP